MSNVITNDLFATRLRRERERLGLTQQEFADKVGVSRMSQVNYESGKRYPGEAYFKGLEAMEGFDVLYIWTGRRREHLNDGSVGAHFLLRAIAITLGLDINAFDVGLEEVTRNVEAARPIANCHDPCGSPWMMEDTGGVRASTGRGRSIL
jgi:transcriptional regulator with XRE-family HTH domain